MKKYHVATGDGKAYYGVNYESYREAKGVLEFSQKRDPQAHIVEEEYHFTNADRIRAMSDVELAVFLDSWEGCNHCIEHERLSDNPWFSDERCDEKCAEHCLDWLKQPAE